MWFSAIAYATRGMLSNVPLVEPKIETVAPSVINVAPTLPKATLAASLTGVAEPAMPMMVARGRLLLWFLISPLI